MSSWVLPIVVLACLRGSGPGIERLATTIGSGSVSGPNPRAHSSHPGKRFPNPASTGVPAGWKPARTRNADLHVTQPGAVVQDLLLRNADLLVDAPNVTIRRVKLQGGQINNAAGASLQQRSRHRAHDARAPAGRGLRRRVRGGGQLRRLHRPPGEDLAARGGIPKRRSIGGLRPGPDQGLVREDRHSAGSLRPALRRHPGLRRIGVDGHQHDDRLPPASLRDGALLRALGPGEHERQGRAPARHGRRLSLPPRGARQRLGSQDRRRLVGVRAGRRQLLGGTAELERSDRQDQVEVQVAKTVRSQPCTGTGN